MSVHASATTVARPSVSDSRRSSSRALKTEPTKRPSLREKQPSKRKVQSDKREKHPSVSSKKADVREKRPSVASKKTDVREKQPNESAKRPNTRVARPSVANKRVSAQEVAKKRAKQEKASESTRQTTEAKESKASVATRLQETKRKLRSLRASMNFKRQFGAGQSASTEEAGPRAALYKGEMGSSQRKATRMQDEASPQKKARNHISIRGVFTSIASSPRLIMASTAVVCMLLVGGFLYPSARQWYQTERHYQQVQAEYTAVVARNQSLESDIAYLQTDEGIEQRAREQFGWVKPNEYAVRITNLEGIQTTKRDATPYAQILPGSVAPPATWYSPVLDVIFGVSSVGEESASAQKPDKTEPSSADETAAAEQAAAPEEASAAEQPTAAPEPASEEPVRVVQPSAATQLAIAGQEASSS